MNTKPAVSIDQAWIAATCAALGGTNAFADKISVHPSTVSRVINGKARVSGEFVAAVLTAFPIQFSDAFNVVETHTTHTTHKAAS